MLEMVREGGFRGKRKKRREKREREEREKEKRKFVLFEFLGLPKPEFITPFDFSKRVSFFAYFEPIFNF